MAKVKINSATNNQPATAGPKLKNTKGLIIKKKSIVCLYHVGDCPKKLRPKAAAKDLDIFLSPKKMRILSASGLQISSVSKSFNRNLD